MLCTVIEACELTKLADIGSGLVPTLLDDVEQDLTFVCTEIDMTVGDSLQGVSVPQDVIHALEHDLFVTVAPADPNAPARVVGCG